MPPTIEFDSGTIHPVTSAGGGVYTTRRGRKSIDESLAKHQTDQAIDEENGSVTEKDVLDERDVREKQVRFYHTLTGDSTANHMNQVVWKMANLMVG